MDTRQEAPAVRLTLGEADLLVRICVAPHGELDVRDLVPQEKGICNRLVKKGMAYYVEGAFYKATDAGRQRATSIY